MRRRAVIAMAGGGWLLLVCGAGAAPPTEDQRIGKADEALFQALASGKVKDAAALLADGFTWTGSDGSTLTASQLRANPPKPGPYVGTDLKLKVYGQVAVITTDLDHVYALRVWIRTARGWRALVYHEVTVGAPPSGSATPIKAECENPCLTVPYAPRSLAERDAIASWQALERAVSAGKSADWAPHVADEFMVVSNMRVQTKAERIAAIDKGGTAPAPLVSARFFDYGDTLVMTAQHQPYVGKPQHVTRVWIKRANAWQMAISFQTAIQAAPAG